MRKTLLMLILCVPLAWIAWREALRLYEVSMWSPPSAHKDGDEDTAKVKDLEKIKREADAIIEIPHSVAGTIVRLDPPSARDHDTRPFPKAILDHAREREEGREKVEIARQNAAGLES